MIKIGKILIDPTGIDTILPHKDATYGPMIQIIYKSGVVKNIPESRAEIKYSNFLEDFIKASKKAEDVNLIKTVLAVQQQIENANTNNT